MSTESDHVDRTQQVYDHSAPQFVDAVGTAVSPRFEAALDRAVLDAFAEEIDPGGIVLDAGCGPGRIARYLAARGLTARGLEVRGIDISSAMIEAARVAHPDLRFDVASLTDLGVGDGECAAVVYWYSIITTPLGDLSAVWAELDRVLAPEGRVLVAFQSDTESRDERPNAYGSGVDFTLFRHQIEDVASSLDAAGFEVTATVRREASLAHETTAQGFLLVQRSSR